ncbi:MAG: beta-glucosidase, partial [Spirochaetaceae bacterium]
SGDVSPSGRLVDTIAYRLEDYPSSEHFGSKEFNCYTEDIYVGYRYFETFKPQAVQYPFGAGLSYTTFAHESVAMSEHGSGAAKVLTCTVTVKNTGSEHAGKEVVQVYCEAPQGSLGKPARVLVGFAKTSLLAPGQTESVRISIPLASLASYDDSGATGHKSAMVLEPGSYRFYVGGSVRDARLVHPPQEVPELLVVEQLEEALAPTASFARIKPGDRLADGTYEKASEPVPQRTVSLADRIGSRLPPTLPVTGNQGITLRDVKEGRASIESFVAQMNGDDLAALIRGEGMCSPRVTPGTASAFGGVTDRLCELGIPVAAAADGPSGIRMDSGHKASQVPIATLLACTWNRALNAELFALVGAELRAYEIDTLLGPGINIHRHPLNGRNFEYFSEDPLITGTIAAAQTSGLASTGVSGTIKHFAANDQETARSDADSIVSERALREIHLKGFEIAVKEGGASSVMTAYNPLNGHWCASNYDLNTTILREQWGYTGIVMTDWWAKMNHPVDGGEANRSFTAYMVRAQNDLYMVVENEKAASNPVNDNTLAVLESGGLTLGELQRSAVNICRFLMSAPVMERPLAAYDPIKSFRSVSVASGDAVPVEEDIDYAEQGSGPIAVRVDTPGVYQVKTTARNARHPMAQSSCTLYLNGEFAMTLSLNGTEGRPVEVSGRKIRLEAGYYTVRIDFVKPGIVLDTLRFTEIEA